MKTTVALLALTMSVFPVVASSESPAAVVVFTTQGLPVDLNGRTDVVVYELDVADRLMQEMSANLPVDPEAARREALQRLQSERGRQRLEKLQVALEGIVLAWSHGVEALPAILIDDEALVVGVYSVDTALEVKRAQRRRR